jgi:hypothetical protein
MIICRLDGRLARLLCSNEKRPGATIDLSSPNRVSEHGMLAFFRALLDEGWVEIIKCHYNAVKSRLAAQPRSRK